ncbi:MAG: class C sortase [Micrococcaceae bacterium]
MTRDTLSRPRPGKAPAAALRAWRPNKLTIIIAVIALVGAGILLYPSTASWITSYNQSKLIVNYSDQIENVHPSAPEQLAMAHRYNEALQAGVNLEANANIAVGDGTLRDESLDYENILSANDQGLMARVKIPAIEVDLPIYHGTSDEILNRGAGHLEGSHLPIGGADTHSVITAHRGLANAEMFTNLDQVEVGDRFTMEVFGEVLTYEVRETKVVQPDDTDTLRPVAGRDLVTLITCTPLGINSHRILVTGERVTPTPIEDVTGAGQAPEIPGFPWWAVIYLGTILVVGIFVWRSGYSDARAAARVTATH